MSDPTRCDYAPPGEYIKDHSIVVCDGRYHLFAISGTAGYYHGYTGNEETVSWSVSENLADWEFRGHVLHATQRAGHFDRHMVWAPFCYRADDGFYMYYTGIVHPHRAMEYRRLGHDHPPNFAGHVETQGIARSADLTDWEKISDPATGAGIPGRDAHVVRDDEHDRYLLYSCIHVDKVNVSVSTDLINWTSLGLCCTLPRLTGSEPGLGPTSRAFGHFNVGESPTVMRHPLSGRWILLLNWQYVLSDDPTSFDGSQARLYDAAFEGRCYDYGFACEMVEHEGRWFRSGTLGARDHWRIGFTEVVWDRDGAFRIRRPSIIAEGAPEG